MTTATYTDQTYTDQTRAALTRAARAHVTRGEFVRALTPLIAIPTESPRADCREDQLRYLQTAIAPMLQGMGFTCRILENRVEPRLPLLYAERIEAAQLPTVLSYGHGDVLWGMAGDWQDGRSPWQVEVVDGRIYGRGTVDNKGQHLLNLTALKLLIDTTGRLGFNLKILLETGEESGSLGLHETVVDHREMLRADVFIASDGPRTSEEAPTVFLGARGGYKPFRQLGRLACQSRYPACPCAGDDYRRPRQNFDRRLDAGRDSRQRQARLAKNNRGP